MKKATQIKVIGTLTAIVAIMSLTMACPHNSDDGPSIPAPNGYFTHDGCNIPIYGNKDAASIANLQTWYDQRDGDQQAKFKAGITHINTMAGATANVDGTILNLGETAGLGPIGAALGPVIAQLNNGVYMAYDHATNTLGHA